jgi:hypothetical protein
MHHLHKKRHLIHHHAHRLSPLLLFLLSAGIVLLRVLTLSQSTEMRDRAQDLSATQSAQVATPSAKLTDISASGSAIPTQNKYYDASLREGTFVSYHEDDFVAKTAKNRYFLISGERQVELAETSELQSLRNGTQIQIDGQIGTSGIMELTSSPRVISTRDVSTQELISGTRKVAVILLNFPDAPLETTPTVSSANTHLRGQLHDYMNETSFGKVNLTGDSYGWFTATIGKTCELFNIGNEAVKVADPSVNFSQYQHLMVVFPKDVCTFAGIGYVGFALSYTTNEGTIPLYTTAVPTDYFELRSTSHEIGHNFGARHSNGWECGSLTDGPNCTSTGYANHYETMGGNLPFHFGGNHKELFGWLPTTSVMNVTTDGTYAIRPIESATTLPQVLKIKRDAKTSYYVENRVATGFDTGLPTGAVNGAVIKIAPTIISSGDSHIIDSSPGTSTSSYVDFSDAAFPLGKSLFDANQGLIIKPISKSNGELKVEVYHIEPPTLLSPTNGATNILTRTPKFDWQDVIGSDTRYTLQASTVPSFASTLINTTVTTSEFTPTVPLSEGVTIYWRVRSVYPGAVSAWSSTFSFVSANPPTAPTLKTPATNTLTQTQINTLTWAAATLPSPAHYELQISTQTGMSFEDAIIHRSPDIAAPTLAYTTPSLTRGTAYYWRVRAVTGRGEQGPWSTIFALKIAPDKPTLISPGNGSTSVPSTNPTFDWNDVTRASNYYIQLSLYPTMASPFKATLTGGPTSSWRSPTAIAEGKKIYWRVYAVSAVGNGAYSDIFSFTSADGPTAPVATTPANNTLLKTTTAQLGWKPSTSPAANTYALQVSTTTGVTFESGIVDENLIIPGTSTTYTTRTLPMGTIYYWRVRGISSTGVSGPWSAILSFKISLDEPNLVAPASGSIASSTRPVFDWSDVTGSTHYVLQRSLDGVTFTNLSPLVTTSAYTPTADLLPKGGVIYWRVISYSAAFGYSAPSQERTLTLANPPSIPIASSPVNNAVLPGYQTTLTWKAVTGIGTATPDHYHVQVATDRTFTTIVDEKTNVPLTPTTVSYQTKILAQGTKHYWRVRSVNSLGQYSLWSTPWGFTTKTRIAKLGSKTLAPATNSQSLLFTHSFTGTDRLVVVAASYRSTSGAAGKIEAVTFGSSSLRPIRRDQHQEYVSELWYLDPLQVPFGTSGTVTVRFVGSTDSHQVTAMTFTDVDPLNPIRKNSSGAITGVGNGADPSPYTGAGNGSLTVPTAVSELQMVTHTTYTSTNTVTLGTGQTLIRKTAFGNSYSSLSTKPGSSAAPFTWTSTKNWPWAASGISIVGK